MIWQMNNKEKQVPIANLTSYEEVAQITSQDNDMKKQLAEAQKELQEKDAKIQELTKREAEEESERSDSEARQTETENQTKELQQKLEEVEAEYKVAQQRDDLMESVLTPEQKSKIFTTPAPKVAQLAAVKQTNSQIPGQMAP